MPIAAFSHALVFVLLTWACAAVIMCWIFASVSMESLRVLLFASIVSSVPAMWFVPALLMLTTPVPILVATGLLLIANTTRLLVSRSAPARLTERTVGKTGIAPAVAGAVVFQFGICVIYAGYALAAAGLFVFGATVWTLVAVARGSLQPRKVRKTPHAVLSIVVTVILAILLSDGAFEMQGDPATDEVSLFQDTLTVFQRLTFAPKPKPEAARAKATPLARKNKDVPSSGKSGVPGVVLRPDRRAERQHIFLSAGKARVSLARNLTFPFTGEYHLYLTSSRRVPPDAVVHTGTPLDEAYLANAGNPMETEAYQALTPPLDFRECGKILLAISSGETTPASASLRLVTAGLEADLGTEIFGLDPAAKETLEFRLPSPPRTLIVTAIRVLFRRNPTQQDQSTKVAIERFTLVPAIP